MSTTTKERPIIFDAESVRAILAGRKTQTRRIIKPQPSEGWEPAGYGDVHRLANGYPVEDKVIGWGPTNDDGTEAYPCPYGKVGDLLWVREAFIGSDHALAWDCGQSAYRVKFKADQPAGEDDLPYGWTSPLFLRKDDARLWLRLVSVRVERLQDITEEDAIAEGIELGTVAQIANANSACKSVTHRSAYSRRWDDINAKRGFPWEGDWWVWVVEFERVEGGAA